MIKNLVDVKNYRLRLKGPNSGLSPIVQRNNGIVNYLTMDLLNLESGQEVSIGAADVEYGIVINGGNIVVVTDEGQFDLKCRRDQFSGLPHAVYVPAGKTVCLKAQSKVDAAVYGTFTSKSTGPVSIVAPKDIEVLKIGEGNWYLEGFFIIGKNVAADKLIVGETWIPAGNWSSCPPHSHDKNTPGQESELEEIYYFRFNPPQGFGFQAVYTDSRDIEEVYMIRDRDVVMVPRGYHPNVAGPGYAMRMQWGMAGPERSWLTKEDPEHAWISKAGAVHGVKEHNF